MQIRISSEDRIPIYRQIVKQIKYLIASNRLQAGEEIPTIRGLAEQLTVNPNTVARAYMELENEGVVTKRHGTGTFVSELGSPLARGARLKILRERVDALLAEADQLEVAVSDVIDLIESRHAKMHGQR